MLPFVDLIFIISKVDKFSVVVKISDRAQDKDLRFVNKLCSLNVSLPTEKECDMSNLQQVTNLE